MYPCSTSLVKLLTFQDWRMIAIFVLGGGGGGYIVIVLLLHDVRLY